MKRLLLITVLLLAAYAAPISANQGSEKEMLDSEFLKLKAKISGITKAQQMLILNGNEQVPTIALYMSTLFTANEMDCFFKRQPIPEEITRLQIRCSDFLLENLKSDLRAVEKSEELMTVSVIESYLDEMCSFAYLPIRKCYHRGAFPLMPFLRQAQELINFELTSMQISARPVNKKKNKTLAAALRKVRKLEKNIAKASDKDLKILNDLHKNNEIWKDFFHIKY